MSKVTSVTVTKSGNIPARSHNEPSALQMCQDKWEHLRADVKGKLWSECPPEMVGDFMRAMSNYFVENFHEDALMKAFQYVGCSVFKTPDCEGFDLTSSYLGSQANAVLSVKTAPEDKFNSEMGQEPTVTFDIVTSATTDDGVRSALGEWAEEEEPQTRIVFNPLTSLPNSDIVSLVKQIEQKVGAEDLLVMSTAALMLLFWAECERTNAETGELIMRGLSEKNEEVRPGEKVVAGIKVQHLDKSLDTTPVSEDALTYQVTSKTKKVKI